VIVEQREPSGYEVFESQEPAERAQGLARWAVTCAPAAETTFRVKHRRMVSRREQVRSFNLKQLQEFLRGRFLDEPTYKALAQVLQIYATIAQHQARLRQIEQERQQIYKRQQQTQGSLGPLARDGEEGKLRSRYVQQLNDLENQLNRLTHEESGLQAEIARLEQEAAGQIARLSKE
jgi:septal ring factor EnvC (AmiA/AmiB activator)